MVRCSLRSPFSRFRHEFVIFMLILFVISIMSVFYMGCKSLSNSPSSSHLRTIDATTTPSKKYRTRYPPRENMGQCPPLFGKVMVFIAIREDSYQKNYAVAQRSLECYLKGVNYTLKIVDITKDPKVLQHCKHNQFFYKKHCAVSVYLEEADWMLVLDADTGVVNPNHCIEEWIDDRVDIIFYERFWNWEIASGNYLVKNTTFAKTFLRKWSDYQYSQSKGFSGADNGALQIHILETVLPDAKAEIKACKTIWNRAKTYEAYMGFVTCVKVTLGATRLWPGKLLINRRGHGFVRDGVPMTNDNWCEKDFMFHGWKYNDINIKGWESPFEKILNVSECGPNYGGWNWRNKMRKSIEEIREQLARSEYHTGHSFPNESRILPYLVEPDVGECWPYCDDQL